MKILWISHILPFPPQGGVTQRSYNLIKQIARRNEVHLFSMNQKAWNPTEEQVKAARGEFLKFCKSVEVFNIASDKSRWHWMKLILKGLFSKEGYTVNWTKSERMTDAIAVFLRNNPIDVIHFDTIGLSVYNRDLNNYPRILNHHNIESHLMLRRAEIEKNPLKRFYFSLEGRKLLQYEKQVCKKFDLNLVVSDLDGERLQQILPGLDTRVVPNGVDVDFFKPLGSDSRPRTMVFTASLDWYPNIDAAEYFIKEVFPLIKADKPGVKFLLAGRRPAAKINELVKSDPSIEFRADVPDIRPIIESGEVYVCPIRDGGGTKLKLLDAMSMGKAIVTTSVGAEGLSVKDSKHLLIADTAENFASSVIRLLDDADLKRILSKNARKLVEERYSWNSIGENLNQLYLETKGKLCAEYAES